MAGKNFWKSDWFLRVVAMAVFLLSATDLVQSLACDRGVRAFSRELSGDIAVIAIEHHAEREQIGLAAGAVGDMDVSL